MTDQFMEILQGILVTIALGIVSYLTYVVGMFFNYLKVKTGDFFESRTTASQRETLHRLAEEAYARAEKIGRNKLYVAIEYVTKHMQQKGIPISEEEIRAAIEKAWIQFDRKNKIS